MTVLAILIDCRSWAARIRQHRGRLGGLDLRGTARILSASGALLAATAVWSESHAQYVPNYFQTGVPGYDQELGVTVLTRQRPLYQQPGIRAGSFIIQPNLDESFGYNSNVLGTTDSSGSWLLETNPSILATSDWSRHRLGASFSIDNQRYFDLPHQNQTNWNVSLGGGYTIGRSELTLAYSHLALHQIPTQVGSLQTEVPIPFTVDDFRTDYTFEFGNLKVIPNVEFSIYRYGSTTGVNVSRVAGQPSTTGTIDQSFADSNVLQGGVTLRYGASNERNLLLVLQGVDAHFPHPQAGTPAPNSTGFTVLGGIDYLASGVFRYQLLAGVAVRTFSASQFKTQVQPVLRGDVIWTPTGLTSVTGTVIRTLQNPTEAGSSGYAYTSAQLQVDHELRRDVVLEGRGGVTRASYFQQGDDQTIYSIGGSVTWFVNRNMRVVGSYQYNKLTGGGTTTAIATTSATNAALNGNLNTLVTGAFSQNIALLTLHFGI